MTNLSDKNIGVVADANGGLTVKLSKDLTGINSITGLSNTTWDANNIVSGRAATEDQLQAVASGITNTVNANKVIAGDNISVSQNADGSGTTVSLKNDITLGDKTDAAKQVNINGDAATVTAGSDTNQVVVDGSKGQITTAAASPSAIRPSMLQKPTAQSLSPKRAATLPVSIIRHGIRTRMATSPTGPLRKVSSKMYPIRSKISAIRLVSSVPALATLLVTIRPIKSASNSVKHESYRRCRRQ